MATVNAVLRESMNLEKAINFNYALSSARKPKRMHALNNNNNNNKKCDDIVKLSSSR